MWLLLILLAPVLADYTGCNCSYVWLGQCRNDVSPSGRCTLDRIKQCNTTSWNEAKRNCNTDPKCIGLESFGQWACNIYSNVTEPSGALVSQGLIWSSSPYDCYIKNTPCPANWFGVDGWQNCRSCGSNGTSPVGSSTCVCGDGFVMGSSGCIRCPPDRIKLNDTWCECRPPLIRDSDGSCSSLSPNVNISELNCYFMNVECIGNTFAGYRKCLLDNISACHEMTCVPCPSNMHRSAEDHDCKCSSGYMSFGECLKCADNLNCSVCNSSWNCSYSCTSSMLKYNSTAIWCTVSPQFSSTFFSKQNIIILIGSISVVLMMVVVVFYCCKKGKPDTSHVSYGAVDDT